MAADPINLAAWQLSTKTDRVLQAAPYTQPEADQLVVHNYALAINPVDWMIQLAGSWLFRWLRFPLILGYDLAGQVIYGDFLPQAFASGRYQPAPQAYVIGQGLAAIQTGLDRQERGVSAQKVEIWLKTG